MQKVLIEVVMGSDSDLQVMEHCGKVLDEFNIPYRFRIISAHRTPGEAALFSKNALKRGVKVIIAGAGAAAHLAGAIASHTTLPVIGIPIASSPLKGIDSLLSTVQMPGSIPVATMAIGEAGAKNAAIFAVEVLALEDKNLQRLLKLYKENLAAKVKTKDKRIRKKR